MSSDLLLIGYNEEQQAFGKGNDLYLDYSAGLKTLSGVDKLKQDVLKILLTERGTNSEDVLYGSNLLPLLLGTKQSLTGLYADIKREVIDSIKYLDELNINNEDPDERIYKIESLEVVKLGATAYDISMILITDSGKNVGITGSIGGENG